MGTPRGPYQKKGTPLEKCVDRILEKTIAEGDCWLFTGKRDADGYGSVHWNYREYRVHRLVYQFFVGEIPGGLRIRHSCHVRNCVNPDHLRPGTALDNTRDMMEAGRHKTGGGNPAHDRNWGKLIVEQVNEMRRLAREGMTQNGIAKRFGVSQSVAGDAICGHTYRDATEPPVPRRGWGPGHRRV